MPNAENQTIQTVVAFLGKRRESLDALDWDQDLIEARILDSLAFVEFLLLLEELTGAPIDLAVTDIENFRSLNRINALIAEVSGGGHA